MSDKPASGEGKHCTWTTQGDTVVIRMRYSPRAVFNAFEEIEAEFMDAARNSKAAKVIINLDVIENMTSRMLGLLAALSKHLKGRGGTLAVCRLRPEPLRAFRLCRMDAIIKAYDSEQDARKAMGV